MSGRASGSSSRRQTSRGGRRGGSSVAAATAGAHHSAASATAAAVLEDARSTDTPWRLSGPATIIAGCGPDHKRRGGPAVGVVLAHQPGGGAGRGDFDERVGSRTGGLGVVGDTEGEFGIHFPA
jgi:hypothetical protein